jgi:hypothetical protein
MNETSQSPACRAFSLRSSIAPTVRTMIKSTVPSNRLTPFDVISPIEAGEHHARRCTLARELVRHVASHHGKPSWPEPGRRMIGHLHHHDAANDDQLLLGGVRMPRYEAPRGCSGSTSTGPSGGPRSRAPMRNTPRRDRAQTAMIRRASRSQSSHLQPQRHRPSGTPARPRQGEFCSLAFYSTAQVMRAMRRN